MNRRRLTAEHLRLLLELQEFIEDRRGDPFVPLAQPVNVTATTENGEPVL